MKSKAKQKTFINNMITYAIVVVAYIVVQILMGTGHMSSLMKGLLVPFCIYVIMAVSLNLTVGILGELSLGHAGFMCVGAFAGALFSKCMKGSMDPTVSLIIAVIIGAVVAAVFGILIGIPVLRLKGDYLAIVTLAFGEIIKNIINVLYVGIDSNGIHFSMKDQRWFRLPYFFKRLHVLKYGCRRRSADQGCPGYYRYTSGSNFYHWCDPGTDHFIYCNEPGQFPYRPRYHGYPR